MLNLQDTGLLSVDENGGFCPAGALCTETTSATARTTTTTTSRSSTSTSTTSTSTTTSRTTPISLVSLFPSSPAPAGTSLPATTANLRRLYDCKPCGSSDCSFTGDVCIHPLMLLISPVLIAIPGFIVRQHLQLRCRLTRVQLLAWQQLRCYECDRGLDHA